MRKESQFRVILILFLTLFAVVGVWSPAMAQDGEEPTEEAAPAGTSSEFFRGRQGLFSSAGFDPETTMLENAGDKTRVGQVRLARNPVRLVAPEGGVLPLTYVYFDLWPWQARAYRDGKLNIFYENQDGGWSECSSIVVDDPEAEGQVEDDDETAGRMRIACVAPMATTFGIGTKDPSAVSDIIR